jgi:hypothetical protein
MKNVLIIGSSYSIKSVFSKKFSNHSLNFINFRKAWKKKKFNNYDLIIISGFHHNSINDNFSKIYEYIIQYSIFVLRLENYCKELFLISTYIPSKISFSRVVFFYKKLLEIIISRKKIKIVSFKKIIDDKNKDNFFFKILMYLGFKFIKQIDIINNYNNFVLKKVPDPIFFFIKIKKNMIFERAIRLFDYG